MSNSTQTSNEPSLPWQRIIFVAIAVYLLLFAIAAVASHVCFGGIEPGMAWLRGAAVFVDPPVRDLGEITADETVTVEFNLRNLRWSPVRIVGATPDCSCVVVDGMPLNLDCRSQGRLAVQIQASSNEIGEDVMRVIPLHLNVDSVTPTLIVKARVKSSLKKGD